MSPYSIATRSTYGLTGCYPECTDPSDLCYNYKTERVLDFAQDPLRAGLSETWRAQMGQMLSGADDRLNESNISFVRRQVLNNGPNMNMGKEIFEWQIKCSKSDCTNDPAETGKIKINDILGPDGIPEAAAPASPGWYITSGGPESCDQYCSHLPGNLQCDPYTKADITDPDNVEAAGSPAAYESIMRSLGLPCQGMETSSAAAAPYISLRGDQECTMLEPTLPLTHPVDCAEPAPGGGGTSKLCKCVGEGGPVTPVVQVADSWHAEGRAAPARSCDDVCGAVQNSAGDGFKSCVDGYWGATDEASFREALISAIGSTEVSTRCNSFLKDDRGLYSNPIGLQMAPAFSNTDYGGVRVAPAEADNVACLWADASYESRCSAFSTSEARLCKCVD
jgi:hypothetical protein